MEDQVSQTKPKADGNSELTRQLNVLYASLGKDKVEAWIASGQVPRIGCSPASRESLIRALYKAGTNSGLVIDDV
ncbi:hypothetical protein [cf. Phormidesmis sp. LEGE 11477]|uniref:hypothetical protein n=1 Tax=cf. Phormidesmis sp. LEGE 11477 TaxID=1828680 RepID=UPI00187EAFBF|nr:hypothetical protein [cf. Phormidesmis sp. LEGE 11477]MBE9063877.1 hypothetical protein [cf. Phormidesmis sp. LEGE 11477]